VIPHRPVDDDEWRALEYTMVEFGVDVEQVQSMSHDAMWDWFVRMAVIEEEPDAVWLDDGGHRMMLWFKSWGEARWDKGLWADE